MRALVATVVHPFIQGGAEAHARSLVKALRERDIEAELLTLPFRFFPAEEVLRAQEVWASENLARPNNYEVDLLICLKFPSWGAMHPRKVAWVLHQHRSVYELFDPATATPQDHALRDAVHAYDRRHLGSPTKVFANSQRVADRLRDSIGIASQPLYHPPPLAERHHHQEALPFIFAPSRLETLKRQALLVEAMRYVQAPVVALLSGQGGQRPQVEELIGRYGLQDRVRLCGHLSDEDLVEHYARCLGVYFAPFDEDYGYVTLEAMLSGKPVITAHDSGGPLEFVRDGETGFVVEPAARAVADAIDRLFAEQARAERMGKAGRERYLEQNISWDHVVARLTAA